MRTYNPQKFQKSGSVLDTSHFGHPPFSVDTDGDTISYVCHKAENFRVPNSPNSKQQKLQKRIHFCTVLSDTWIYTLNYPRFSIYQRNVVDLFLNYLIFCRFLPDYVVEEW